MWVKICGNTNLEDAQLAVEAGADALGFLFAESSRRVTPAQVSAITAHLPVNIEKIGIFDHANFEEIVATVKECGLTGIQMHSSLDPTLSARLREHFSAKSAQERMRILGVIHYSSDLNTQLRAAQDDPAIDAVLVDSRTATLLGGTGIRFDWHSASHSFRSSASRLRLIAAGGLNPDNVGEAISTLRPWGVDVVTGVEASPGKKDPARVRRFITNARIAADKAKLDAPVEV
jgi:phosphoribosylanthranilate isomerase